MSAASSRYLSTLHNNMDTYFSLEEIRTLCFDMSVDFDSVRGEGKSARIRELLIALSRNGRLPELLDIVKQERRHVEWPPIPPDFELPQSLQSDSPAAPTTINNYYGDVAMDGGSITKSSGDTFNLSGNFEGANVNVKSTLENVAQTVGALPKADDTQKAELQRLLVELNNQLQQAPEDQAKLANELSESTKILIDETSKEQPNQTMIKLLGSGLQAAAENLAPILPNVVKIVGDLVGLAAKL